MKKNDTDNFNKGRKIAEEIASIVLSKSKSVSPETEEWLSKNKYSKDVVNHLCDEDTFSESLSRYSNTNKKRAVEELSMDLKRKSIRRNRLRGFMIPTAAAAMAIFSFVIFRTVSDVPNSSEKSIIAEKPVEKESAKPILIVSDGTKIDLTQKRDVNLEDIMSNQNRIATDVIDNNREDKWNKIIIPFKYTYNVVLSDGTTVFLNANSTLEYPSSFDDDVREVRLIGEAFFDVKKDEKRAFVVNVSDVKIKVYGTKFNINSYDTKNIKTSLVSGSVGVSLKNNREIMIEPSQMITVNSLSGENKIGSFNVLKYEAWQNNFFRCDDEPIHLILEDIAMWYGVSFDFESKESQNVKVSASIRNSMSIEQVVKLLEVASGVKITKKGGNNYSIK